MDWQNTLEDDRHRSARHPGQAFGPSLHLIICRTPIRRGRESCAGATDRARVQQLRNSQCVPARCSKASEPYLGFLTPAALELCPSFVQDARPFARPSWQVTCKIQNTNSGQDHAPHQQGQCKDQQYDEGSEVAHAIRITLVLASISADRDSPYLVR